VNRVIVIGPTSSGKSTLGKRLAGKISAAYIELDSLHWEPDWVEAPLDVFRARVTAALAAHERWVVDGNHSKARDLIWTRADTAIWLDYGFWLVFSRNIRRTFSRALRRTELWSGNRESLRRALFSHDSIILWLITSYRSVRRKYEAAFASGKWEHLALHRFRSPAELERWLRESGSS
jgi:adenylate kinase family enzyme